METVARRSAAIGALVLSLLLCYMAFGVETADAATKIKSASNVKSGIQVTWTKDYSKSGYYIYRKAGNQKNWTMVKSIKDNRVGSWIDPKTSSGVIYTYKVNPYVGKKSTVTSKKITIGRVLAGQTVYLTGQETKLKKSAKSGSKSVTVPYMAGVKLVNAVKHSSSGTWYKVKYGAQSYYLWVKKGVSRFVNKKSSFSYVGKTSGQKAVLNKAMYIYNRGNTVYIRNAKVDSGTLTSRGYAFDCSGFVRYVYDNAVGYNLPKTAKKIYAMKSVNGRTIVADCKGKWNKNKVRPGDILCFDEDTNHCAHVGIYLGNNEFIHAVKDYGVTISPMEGCWVDYFMAAKRFVP